MARMVRNDRSGKSRKNRGKKEEQEMTGVEKQENNRENGDTPFMVNIADY